MNWTRYLLHLMFSSNLLHHAWHLAFCDITHHYMRTTSTDQRTHVPMVMMMATTIVQSRICPAHEKSRARVGSHSYRINVDLPSPAPWSSAAGTWFERNGHFVFCISKLFSFLNHLGHDSFITETYRTKNDQPKQNDNLSRLLRNSRESRLQGWRVQEAHEPCPHDARTV